MLGQAPEDFVDILRCFQAAKVDFIIVGAYALARHGHPRATQDIDILVRPSAENAKRVIEALNDFGAPVSAHGIQAKDFEEVGNIYQIGLPPIRIDVLTSVTGLTYDAAAMAPVLGQIGTETVRFIGPRQQLINKESTNRPKDAADALVLRQLLRDS